VEKAGDDLQKAASLTAKTIKLKEKVEKLSEADTVIYTAEVARLMAGGSASSGAVTTSSDGTKYVIAQNREDFRYELTADGAGVVITGMNQPTNGNYYNVIKIPAKIEGYPVVEVQRLDYKAAKLSVTFPDTVTALGSELFREKDISVKLPPKITEIPFGLFYQAKITEITIPNGVTRIGTNAFSFCRPLATITIPDSVTEIDTDAFMYCSELTTVKLPAHPIQYTASIWSSLSEDRPPPEEPVLRRIDDERVLVLRPDNGAFRGCSKLSLAMRKAITDSGYGGF
jgi:hypothetical protein